MNKPVCALVVLLSALGGCTSDSYVYKDQPLVDQVDTGMTKEQVIKIGGQPLSIFTRTAQSGTCFDYMFTNHGKQQPFNVSFDGRGKVDHTSFISCPQWNAIQEKAKKPHKAAKQSGMAPVGY
ncbi:osmotically-inducible lipoprotein OsmE [Rhodococcus sp. IEGM1300]